MRVAVIPAVNQPLEIVERPLPRASTGEALVRIDACGVCGSDLFLQAGGFGDDVLPRVPGHEAAGTIVDIGGPADDFAIGDQVALYYIENSPQAPRPNIGPGVRRMGVDVDGAFAEYVVRPLSTLIRPTALVEPAILAVLTDAVATPYHALLGVARVFPGETVAVIGVGGIGSNAIQLAKELGAKVIAISRSEAKQALAREMGADVAVAPHEAKEAVGSGADVVIQCAGSADADALALKLAGFGGRVVFVGASSDSFPLRAVDLIWGELAVMGSRGFTPNDIAAVIDLYLQGRVRTDHLVQTKRSLEEVNEAFADLREGRVLRSVILPHARCDPPSLITVGQGEP
jgi:alcohol dehydrogenase, propanol-preferring